MLDTSKLALIIGVDEYNHKRSDGIQSLKNLPSSKKDALDLCEILKSYGYTIFSDGPIVGSNLPERGYETIQQATQSFFSDADAGQTLVFYFSGHGITKNEQVYLATPEVNPQRPMFIALSLTNLTNLINDSRSTRIVCIIDACYSGAANLANPTLVDKAAAESDADEAIGIYDKIKENVPIAEGKCLMLSSQAYQRSQAQENKNSIYTKYLLTALKGVEASMDEKGIPIPPSVEENGNVTPQSLHDYVYNRVANELKTQTPRIKSSLSSKIILVKHPELSRKPSVDIAQLISDANQYLEDKKYDDAVKTFDRVVLLDPKNYSAYKFKADALVKLKRDSEAITFYEKALEIKPDYVYALRGKGFALYNLSKYNEALEFYDKCLEIDLEDSPSWNYKGLVFYSLRKYDEAITCFDKALAIAPNFGEASKNKESSLEVLRRIKDFDAETSKVTIGSQLSSLREEDWYELLNSIKERGCLPFIGNGACSPFLPPNSEIANKWAKEYRYPWENSGRLELVAEYLTTEHDNLFPKHALATMIKELQPPDFALEEFRKTPYAVLADLNLPIYITTNYDGFMEAALKSKGKEPVSEFCRWNDLLRKDTKNAGIPSVFDKITRYCPTESKPLVYHLYGDVVVPQSMVITESDYNDFVMNLYKYPETLMLPAIIRRALATSDLLLIGYNLDDISFSTIFRGVIDPQRTPFRKSSIMVLLPNKVAIDENTTSLQRYLKSYTETMDTRIYWGSASSFCYDLRRHWDVFNTAVS